jgi:2-polyprenyl-3-methyl-5-hydroxy-6-metoxy-1,4-benzoquinol methylase
MQPGNENLADSSYWDEGYEQLAFSPMPLDYPTVALLYEHLNLVKPGETKSVFEIGVYPGRFMYHFGKLGYELHGIDQTKYLPALVKWLKDQQFKVGQFEQLDVMKVPESKQYDVVFSAGFIEHFVQFKDMISLHAKLVKPGGYVYITAPNFGGKLQYFLHSTLDKQNLDRHYVPSMNVAIWAEVLQQHGFSIVQSGYIGGIDFWVDKEKRSAGKKLLLSLAKKAIKIARKLQLPNRRSYSPECVIIAQKKL